MIEANPHAQVLDLRDPLEFEYRHIPGAVNIQPASVYFLEEVRNQLSASDTLYIYCRMGKSTKEVTQLLLDNGYRVIFNLRGGSVAWDAHLDKERRRKKRSWPLFNSRSPACRQASCSASFFEVPRPVPRTVPSEMASASNRDGLPGV